MTVKRGGELPSREQQRNRPAAAPTPMDQMQQEGVRSPEDEAQDHADYGGGKGKAPGKGHAPDKGEAPDTGDAATGRGYGGRSDSEGAE
ncbi:hypothetical protein [Aurantiacibacter aquimixticola]|uniref:Uncharacterized protein n=1 Tax=Aurantiacibacter aquimixticola TaxID=1958945 RepID=A0A419RU94_9SPHN|nr:hypothetical protein [Aurantiacibacter aquimixticola]RJY09356.1 hypothetical protein D6201_08310 [Aurantiacibacter aquimixticola]